MDKDSKTENLHNGEMNVHIEPTQQVRIEEFHSKLNIFYTYFELQKSFKIVFE